MQLKFLFVFVIILSCNICKANFPDSLYHPNANAVQEISKAVAEAKAQKKHVLIQAGGNWCIWCLRFNQFVTTDPQLDSIIKANYILYHLNYSKENTNDAVFAKYGFPQRFGFPVFIILDGNGNRLNTQNSEYLEQGKGYSKEKTMEFLKNWSPAALESKQYKP
ncbi:MAG: thioredoxin family protein [Chitinophagaceae bacterium]